MIRVQVCTPYFNTSTHQDINRHLSCFFLRTNPRVMKAVYPILVLLAMTSCLQEELSPENYVFRGGWDSPKYAIQIYANGSGVLDIRNRGRCEGNVWIRGDKMTF